MDYSRPAGFRCTFGGLNLRSQPDGLPPNKYSVAKNVRAISDNSIQTRPGYTKLFQTAGAQPITDIRAYTALSTDNLPRYLVRDAVNGVYLDTGTLITTLAGNSSAGASMIPFRPAASPLPWMYIANQADYQKVSAPSATNVCIAQKVGIAEPQSSCEAAPDSLNLSWIDLTAASWTEGGTAAAPSNTTVFPTINSTVGEVFADPINANRYSVEVGPSSLWAIGMLANVDNGTIRTIIQDVIPQVEQTAGLYILGIRYYSGSTGRATIILNTAVSGITGFISSLRRGALVRLNTGAGNQEYCFVLSVTTSSDGTTVSFEVDTTVTHAVAETVVIIQTLVMDGVDASHLGQSIKVDLVSSAITTGTGTLSQDLATNPFGNAFTTGSGLPRQDDYLHLTFNVSDVTKITSIKLILNCGPAGSMPDYVAYVFTYTLSGVPLGTLTGGGYLFGLQIPISSLTDGAGGQTLANCNGIQLAFEVTANVTCEFGSIWIGGGGLPDVGDSGAGYRYRVVPRSSLTGAQGNPCPDMRYSVFPRRQRVTVSLPSVAYDTQIDTYDIYRYGGTITSFRYVGTTPSTSVTFDDNLFDDAALAGRVIQTDNFEPWPTIDVPFIATNTATLYLFGTFLTLVVGSASDWPSNIARWLPGTLIAVPSNNGVFTLRSRPVQNSSTQYTFEIVEEAGSGIFSGSFTVNEPSIARQPLPFVWGPDANGVMFAVGDPLRPGTIYYCKPFNPDSAPDTNTLELCPPSEPLLGGELRDGLSYVYSAMRWWALYPNFGGTNPYTQVERPVGKPPTTPYGSTTDGAALYFWSKDGICSTDGGPGKSLTDDDLYPLFPHDGVPGLSVTRNGNTVAAPGYQYIASFRLCRAGVYLYADYQDSSGASHSLVMDMRNGAWAQDVYHDIMRVHYAPEQTEGTLASGSPAVYALVLMGDLFGNVYKQTEPSNDNGTAVTCKVATFEWTGDDLRALPQWGDGYVDVLPPFSVSVTPVSQQAAVSAPTVIPSNSSRQFVPVSLGGYQVLKFLGLVFDWTDSPTDNTKTSLYIWQPSLLPQPETTINRIEDWDTSNIHGAKYYRGFVLDADTFGVAKGLTVENGDTQLAQQGFSIIHTGQQQKGYAFTPAFVSHLVRLIPTSDGLPWRKFGVRWLYDEWPELTAEWSPWMDMGTKGAKYFRGGTVCVDTNGASVEITIRTSDGLGTVVSLGIFNTAAGQKTEIAFPCPPSPIVGHEFQFIPNGPCRIWWGEATWHVDPYPEITTEWTPILELGGSDAKYVRGVRVVGDSNGLDVGFTCAVDNGIGPTVGTFAFFGKQVKAFAFDPPFVAHTVQLIPTNPVRIFTADCKWDFEVYPELIPEWTPIMEFGGPSNKYYRGVRITGDSNDQPVYFQVLYDGQQVGPLIGPLTFNGKQTLAWPFRPPFIAHNIQLQPLQPVRIWADLSQWDSDPYPEFIAEYTSILELGGPDSKYIQGIKVTGDTGGNSVQLQIVYDGGQIGPLLEARVWDGKSVQVFSFPPFVAHSVQIIPQGAIRIWVDESEWVFEPTPELALQWGPTQWTAHGMTGYHHIQRIEAAYASNDSVQLLIASYDGTSPQLITLPSTGGAYQKRLITLTFNKGQLYQYSAYSLNKFQIFLNDWIAYIGGWGRTEPYTLFHNLGGTYGDKARI